MQIKPILRNKRIIGKTLIVEFDDGSVKLYETIALGVKWFKMSNDAFYNLYGFNFTPQEVGVYEICRRLVYSDEYNQFGKRGW
ncbi:MAG: hypothetical protein K2I93_04360 [Oscillospiraceae bacterium]|nr:hypothetical protein [Oscillospiraceae bacterium]